MNCDIQFNNAAHDLFYFKGEHLAFFVPLQIPMGILYFTNAKLSIFLFRICEICCFAQNIFLCMHIMHKHTFGEYLKGVDRMDFTSMVEWLCNDRGITVSKMLSDLSMGVGTFSTWKKRGTIPSGETISKIANYFGVSSDDLLQASLTNDDIDEARKKAKILSEGKTLQEIENKLSVSYATFKAWVDGASNYYSNSVGLKKIAAFLGITTDDLLGKSSVKDQLSDVQFAFYGEVNDLSDAELEKVLEVVKFIKSQRNENKNTL